MPSAQDKGWQLMPACNVLNIVKRQRSNSFKKSTLKKNCVRRVRGSLPV